MRRYILVALVLCVLVGVACAWPASMESWGYRKSVSINNTGANLTNYQLMFTVNRSAGTDSGFTVFLNGKCESDYDDIRFTTSDEETLCDYWIESSSSTVANIWVEAPSIVNSTAYGSTTLYLYYGNSGATAASDGGATFPFFDDFPGSSLDTGKWTRHGTSYGSVSVTGGEITLSASGGSGQHHGIHSTTTPMTAGYTLEARSKNTAGMHDAVIGCADDPYATYPHGDANTDGFSWYARVGDISTISYRSGANSVYGPEDNLGTAYKTYKIVWESSSSVKFYKDGTLDNTISSSSYIPSFNLPVYFSQDGYAKPSTLVVDWVLVRKYTATEPTVSAWGSEEMGKVINIYPNFSGVPTSGYVPLTVYFTNSSTSENCTINTWQWSFGDSSPNSTQQNPAHTYTTSGLYNVILTITNTSFSLTNSTQRTGYINVTVNTDAPIADFTVAETCGETTDTFYFIDFSTGGGLYAWNWSFGDGSYSELRNPTHQYASEGTYDVNLSVWGAYGFDSLLRENLITVPCGAATPTPTLTVTPTGTPTATGPVPTAEVNETDVGETWIRWVWEDPGEPVDIYIDGAKVESWVNNTTQAYRLTGLNPSERHVLSLYRAGNATLIDQQDVTTLPATWLIVSVLAISIFFAVCTIISRDIYRVLLCSTIACVSSGFLAMIGVGHPWGITIIGIIVALITGVIAVIVALDLRNGDDDE